jgi:hypothetical protein
LQCFGVELLRIELEIVLALLLGLVHGDVGLLGQDLLVLAVLWVGADPDAGRDTELLTEEHEWPH